MHSLCSLSISQTPQLRIDCVDFEGRVKSAEFGFGLLCPGSKEVPLDVWVWGLAGVDLDESEAP